MSSRLLRVFLLLALTACGSRSGPPSNRVTEVPADECEGRTEGWLSADKGQLLYWSSLDDRVPVEADPSNAYPMAITPIMLQDRAYRFSTVVSHSTPGRAVAVRTALAGERAGLDELVEIDGETLESKVLWSPGRALFLLGRSGNQVVLVTRSKDVTHVSAFGLDSRKAVDSRALKIDHNMLGRPHTSRGAADDAGDVLSAWSGASAYVLSCVGGLVCRATVRADRIDIDTAADDPTLTVPARHTPGPEKLPPGLGPPLSAFLFDHGLPVDGVQSFAVPIRPSKCLVRAELKLPAATKPTSCELTLKWSEDTFASQVKVPAGCRLTMGFTTEGSSRYLFALPPSQVNVTLLPGGAYEVRLPPPESTFSDNDCTPGHIWVRAREDGAKPGRAKDLDWGYGYCE